MNGTTATIGGNHGHTLVVSKEDVAAGAEKTYHIQGTSLHDHTVVITAALFTMLQSNTSISTASSFDGHSHPITVTCA